MIRYFVCKTCGRGLASYEAPNFCYADRMDSIEELDREDSVKMGLFRGFEVFMGTRGYAFEFPGDVQFDPFTGKEQKGATGYRLDDFQDKVMEELRAN